MSVHSKLKAEGQSVKAGLSATVPTMNVTRIHSFQQDVAFYLPNCSDHIQKIIHGTKKFYEQSMLAEIGPLLPESPTVADVGANIGNHSLFFAKVIGAKVLAFEPNPEAFSILEANVALNQLTEEIDLHKIGVGSSAGRGEINNVSDVNLGMAKVVAAEEGAVEIQSLDDVLGSQHVDLIKIDVEGMECEVLKGARGVLERCKPLVIAEAATLEELSGIEDLLRPLGYRKVKRYNDTPTFLFQYGFEPRAAEESYTGNILKSVEGKMPKTTGIYAGMATVSGNEVALRAAVTSLLPQVDGLFIYLNGFSEVPSFLRGFDKVKCHLDPDGTRYGDAGKFWGLGQVRDAIYLTCDDDILYPKDYIARMTQELADCGGQSVICVHGSLLIQPLENFYANGARSVLHFANELIRRRQVHVPGTGTCAFHSAVVDIALDHFAAPNMADIWLTKFMAEKDIVSFAVPHRKGWLLPLKVTRPTIYEASSNASKGAYDTSAKQQSVLNEMLPLSVAKSNAEPSVVCLSLEKDSNILSALKELPVAARDPILFVLCDAVTDDLRARIAQSSYNWEVHLVGRNQTQAAHQKDLFAQLAPAASFWKVERRRLVADEAVQDLSDWQAQA